MYGIALIVVIAVMGGAIAYIGDKLGSRVGKKKLSIFGLRPKHTSIVVTIATGIFIAAATVGAMSVVSLDVRTALFGMEKLKTEMAFLNKEVVNKTLEIEITHAELNAKNQEYAALTEKIEETFVRLKDITEERDRTSLERDRTSLGLKTLQANYDAAEKEIGALIVTRNELDERIEYLTSAREGLQADVESLRNLAEGLHQGIRQIREGTVVLRADEMLATTIFRARQNAAQAEEGLAMIIYQTNLALLNRFGVDNTNLDILWITQTDFDRAAAGMTNAAKDIIVRICASANTIYGEPVIGYIELFSNELVYKKGQVVYSETFSSAANDQQAEETILVFLHNVNREAIEKGILPDPLTGTVGTMSGAKLFEAVNRVKRHPSRDPGRERIEVVAIATEDINSVGPLNIDIKIRTAL
jgi:uncharacterized protein (DUF3084 family)